MGTRNDLDSLLNLRFLDGLFCRSLCALCLRGESLLQRRQLRVQTANLRLAPGAVSQLGISAGFLRPVLSLAPDFPLQRAMCPAPVLPPPPQNRPLSPL